MKNIVRYITIKEINAILDDQDITKNRLAMEIKENQSKIHRGLNNISAMSLETYFKIVDYLYDKNLIPNATNISTNNISEYDKQKYLEIIDKLTNENIKLTGVILSLTERLIDSKIKRSSYTHSMVAEE
jgi:hypothetical protein